MNRRASYASCANPNFPYTRAVGGDWSIIRYVSLLSQSLRHRQWCCDPKQPNSNQTGTRFSRSTLCLRSCLPTMPCSQSQHNKSITRIFEKGSYFPYFSVSNALALPPFFFVLQRHADISSIKAIICEITPKLY